MKTEYYTNKWLRRLEIVSMVGATISTPLKFLVLGIQALQSSGSNNDLFSSGIVMIFIGLSGLILFGYMFGSSFKHYIYHQETRDDVLLARFSFILFLGPIITYFIIF